MSTIQGGNSLLLLFFKRAEKLFRIFQGKYEVRQYVLAAHVVPKFLQTGYYKAQFIATKKNSDEFSTFIIHVKLY